MLQNTLISVRQRITQACQRAGRDPSTVTLVGVTKGVTLERIQEAVASGLAVIGENRVQEAQVKHAQLAPKYPDLQWHLIGHLQRNKAKEAVRFFDVIHSVDTVALAQDLQRHAKAQDRTIEVFVQVNISQEATKYGCTEQETVNVARIVTESSHVQLRGLMTIAPWSESSDSVRPIYRRLSALRDTLNRDLMLSMGMSQDFEVAIEEGANLIRVGTAIFGARDK